MTLWNNFSEVHFSSSSWLASELSPTVITTCLDLIRHVLNLLRYFFKLASQIEAHISEWICFLADGNQSEKWLWCHRGLWSNLVLTSLISWLLWREIECNWLITQTLSWLSSSVINLLLYFINELKITDLNFLFCFLTWNFWHGHRSNSQDMS